MKKTHHHILFLISLTLTALMMRAPFTSVSPLLEDISRTLSLSSQSAGLLTTLPLLAFAFFSPLASVTASKTGIEKGILLGLIAVALGIGLRGTGNAALLFTGTALIGLGIAFCNVLLPAFLKRRYPERAAAYTSFYILIMGIGAAVASTLVVPVATLGGGNNWPLALMACLPIAVLAGLTWLSQLSHATRTSTATSTEQTVWRSAAAWKLTAYMAMNSLINYVFVAWYAVIVQEMGYSTEDSGLYHGIALLSAMIPSLIMVPLLSKLKSPLYPCIAAVCLTLTGIVLLLITQETALLAGVLIGMGTSLGFIMGMSMLNWRSTDAGHASALSGMVQSVSYLVAATGPVIFGSFHDLSSDWHFSLKILLACSLVWGLCAVLVSRQGQSVDSEPSTQQESH
ncbi:MFS transporter [Photobacterium sp. CCB-ST2H9]|uniref:MFS transporter n=1 Tax=Photobacterium sp. CCB-ST2H9 TaxID=2912855 RepID=UPI00200401CA|nr:MFS transporter [Photobacterium sp. CCB-ST2H9]UTM59159.1 MFS transporter [Photobacterium sp. CCB-ST2H9]